MLEMVARLGSVRLEAEGTPLLKDEDGVDLFFVTPPSTTVCDKSDQCAELMMKH